MSPFYSSTPARVLLVTARYFPYVGGTEMHNYEVSRRLAARGLDVTVLTTDPSHQLARTEQQADGVQIRRVRAWPAQRDYYFAPGLYREIVKGGWDIVHLQGYHTLVAPIAMFAARRAGIPYLVTFHSGGHSSQQRNAMRGTQVAVLRPLLARARWLVGVSEFEARAFQSQLNLPTSRFVVIPKGSNLPRLSDSDRAAVDRNLIVSVGRLEEYKGHHRLIAALPDIVAHHPGARLRIVGSGPYEAELRRLAEQLGVAERVEIGSIPGSDREAMARLLSQAAVAVLLSEYESQGLGITEALSMGCPAVVADTSALSDLARYPQVKTVPLHADTETVATAVVALMDQERRPVQIVLPTWDDCADSLMTLYRTAMCVPPVRHNGVENGTLQGTDRGLSDRNGVVVSSK